MANRLGVTYFIGFLFIAESQSKQARPKAERVKLKN